MSPDSPSGQQLHARADHCAVTERSRDDLAGSLTARHRDPVCTTRGRAEDVTRSAHMERSVRGSPRVTVDATGVRAAAIHGLDVGGARAGRA